MRRRNILLPSLLRGSMLIMEVENLLVRRRKHSSQSAIMALEFPELYTILAAGGFAKTAQSVMLKIIPCKKNCHTSTRKSEQSNVQYLLNPPKKTSLHKFIEFVFQRNCLICSTVFKQFIKIKPGSSYYNFFFFEYGLEYC